MTIADLPAPSGRRLARAPLELVVWQLVFAHPPEGLGEATLGPQLAELLSADGLGSFTITSQTGVTTSVALGPGAPPPAPTQAQRLVGWQLRRDQLVVTLTEQALSVETTDFTEWKSFAALLRRTAEAAQQLVELPPETRLGLRYVDKVEPEEIQRPADWAGLIAGWLQGPLAHPQLRDVVLAYAQQADLDAGEGLRATVRQRTYPDPERRNKPTMLLDFDTFREGYRLLDVAEVLGASDRMNDISHRLFRAAISDRLYEMFAGEEVGS